MIGEARPHPLRSPCRWCGGLNGGIRPSNGQNSVYCLACQKHVYNAPKTDTGEEKRTVATRDAIPPGQRARILMRDAARCVICAASAREAPLRVGHVLSLADGFAQAVHDGMDLAAVEVVLNGDDNLATMCEPCNLGLGRDPFNPIIWLRLIRARASLR